MRSPTLPIRLLTGAFLTVLAVTGCSGETPEPSGPEEEQGDYDGAKGDSELPRADEIEGAEVTEGEFALTEGQPEEYQKLHGTAWLAQHDDGTTLTVEVTGLPPKGEFMSHLNEKKCDDDYGGDYFKFDPDGGDEPPNVVQLLFESDGDGEAMSTINNDAKTGDGARSVLLHQGDAMIACADFA